MATYAQLIIVLIFTFYQMTLKVGLEVIAVKEYCYIINGILKLKLNFP